MNSSASELKGRSQSVELGTENNFTREMTVILVYTSFFGDTNWVKKGGRCVWYQPEERQCPMDLFEITLNKTRSADISCQEHASGERVEVIIEEQALYVSALSVCTMGESDGYS